MHHLAQRCGLTVQILVLCHRPYRGTSFKSSANQVPSVSTGYVSPCMRPCFHVHMALHHTYVHVPNPCVHGRVFMWSCIQIHVAVYPHSEYSYELWAGQRIWLCTERRPQYRIWLSAMGYGTESHELYFIAVVYVLTHLIWRVWIPLRYDPYVTWDTLAKTTFAILDCLDPSTVWPYVTWDMLAKTTFAISDHLWSKPPPPSSLPGFPLLQREPIRLGNGHGS